MKNLKSFAVAALLAVSASASAQFTNGSSSSASSANTEGWSTFWLEWNPSTMKVDIKDADNESFTGFSLGYSQAFGLTQSVPFFLEAGFGVQYSFKNKELGEDLDFDAEDYELADPKMKTSMFSAKIPVNLIYAFQIPNSSVKVMPFIGANLRFNITGKQKLEWNLSDDMIDYMKNTYGRDWEKESTIFGLPAGGYDHNVFDKKDMGSSDATWKRFQIGWQIGLKARFNDSFLVGVSYGSDFSEISKKTKIATTSITLGYTF